MTTLSNYMKGGEDLNARRKSIISLAFSTMDTSGSGVIEPELLLSTYNAAKHPDVISKKMSEETALSEFLNTFDVGSEVEGKVTRHEFESYYKRISSSTNDDEKFETMIRGLYRIGGHGSNQTSATIRLMAQNDADDKLNTASTKKDIELQHQANKIRENSKAVLGKLVDNNSRGPSDLSSSVLEMTLNSAHPDGELENDSITLGIAAAGPNAPSQSPAYPPRTAFPTPVVAIPAGVAHIVSKLKAKLRSYGVYGFVGLQRAIRSMDKADKRRISMVDFKVAMRKAESGLTDAEVRMLFDYFNNEHRGSIDTENFITVVRSVLNDRRLILVKQAFSKLDLNGEGAIDAGKLAELYDAAAAPDVIAGRATAEDNLYEFLETFDVGGEINGMVTMSEFINYYTNIGSCVDNHEYFEVMLRNAWHLGGERQETSKRVLVTRKDGSQYIEEVEDRSHDETKVKRSMLGVSGVHVQTFNVFKQANDFSEVPRPVRTAHSRPLKEVSQQRQIASNDQPSLNSTIVRLPSTEKANTPIGPDEAIAALGPSMRPRQYRSSAAPSTLRTPDYGVKYIILKLKEEIRSVGLLGFIGLQRRFRAIDRDNTKSLSLADFKKAMRQMNMTLTDGELRMLFEFYDEDNCGLIDHEQFVQGVRDPLTGSRLSLVHEAFNQLDKDGSGLLDASEVASLYDATRHPDVIRGSTTPQQVLSSFLETFDVGCVVQGKVALQEFLNYYANISQGVENDDYFELLIRNVWHVDGKTSENTTLATRRVIKTKPDGTQYVEEVKEERNKGLLDATELAQRAAIVAKLQGRVPSGCPGEGSIVTAESLHKQSQPNKRRMYQQRSTVGLLVDATLRQRPVGRAPVQPSAGEQVVLDRLKGEIAERGPRCLIGLQRAFAAADDDADKLVTLSEFKQALSAVNISLSGPESRVIFAHFDVSSTGLINYEHFVRGVSNPLSDWRLTLVKRAFNSMDRDNTGVIEASRCAQSYDASNHPEVVAGRMTAERALKEFLETFDVSEGGITEKALVEYYTSIGSSIQSDQYFELLLRSTWNCHEHAVEEKDSAEPLLYSKSGKSREPSSIPIAAGSRTKVQGPRGHTARLDWLGHDSTSQFEGYEGRHRDTKREPNSGERMILQNIERSLCQRPPLHGFIALQRAFRAADEGTKTVPLPVFIQISRDLDLGITDPECRVMFEFFNRRGMGLLDWKGFLDCVRPPLSGDRRELVETAFKCLDREGKGAVDASLIVSQYDPTGHPDVFLGVRASEAVMEELLETFDMGGALQGKVTREEFIEYYSNIGAGIDNEDYFELMLIHAWKPLSERTTEEHTDSNTNTNTNSNALYDEPERSSHSTNVTFDVPHTGSRDPRSPPRFSNVPLSASMQNWIGANVDRTAPSPTANAIKYDTIEDRGPRHFNHRKSQIHFP